MARAKPVYVSISGAPCQAPRSPKASSNLCGVQVFVRTGAEPRAEDLGRRQIRPRFCRVAAKARPLACIASTCRPDGQKVTAVSKFMCGDSLRCFITSAFPDVPMRRPAKSMTTKFDLQCVQQASGADASPSVTVTALETSNAVQGRPACATAALHDTKTHERRRQTVKDRHFGAVDLDNALWIPATGQRRHQVLTVENCRPSLSKLGASGERFSIPNARDQTITHIKVACVRTRYRDAQQQDGWY